MKESRQSLGWCRLAYELLFDKNLTDKDILLYCIMLDFCEDELVCSVSQQQIFEASCGRISHNMFYECLKHLERYGYIEHNRTGRKSTYKLADVIGLKRQKAKPAIRQTKLSPEPEQGQQEIKLLYGDYKNVALTVAQFDKLMQDFGEQKTIEYIRKLDEYAHEHGKQYNDCNFTIRKWIAEDNKRQNAIDDVKRQEFAEIDEYLALVNKF